MVRKTHHKKTKDVYDLSKEIIVKQDVIQADRSDFLNYAVTVASSRAIPDARDGLKPIQRFILIALNDAHLNSKATPIKSQKIEGNVMGDYSPHTGSYLSMDYLTQDYTFNLPPLKGKGNWSTIEGSVPAAPRYTEIRNSIYGDDFVERISPDLVPYNWNYSNEKQYPSVLPVSFPALLINGVKSAIAVGFTSNIAPHNPVDALKLTIAYIKNPEITLDEAIDIIKGPDFPTYGKLQGDVKEYYATGFGHFINQGTIIDDPDEKDKLIITEVPFQLGGQMITSYIPKVREMIAANKLPGIKDIEDYSDTDGLNISVILQKGTNHDTAKSMLFAKTNLQQTYNPQWTALDGKTPVTFTLLGYLEKYLKFQHKLVINEFKSELRKDTKRIKDIDTLLTIPKRLNDIIHVAQNTNSKATLVQILMGNETSDVPAFDYDEVSAELIASMRVYQFNSLNIAKLTQEKKDLEVKQLWANKYIHEADLRTQLLIDRHEKTLAKYIKQGLDERKTQLISKEELAETAYTPKAMEIPLTITINKYGYVKTTDRIKSSDVPDDIVVRYNTDTSDALAVITNKGNMYQISAANLHRVSTRDKSRGETIYAVLNKQGIQPDEMVLLYTFRSELERDDHQLIYVTQHGHAKRFNPNGTTLITKTMRSKVQAYKPKDDDELVLAQFVPTAAISTTDIAVFKDRFIKRITLADIPEQSSTTGTGAKTFFTKKTDAPSVAYLFDNTKDEFIINYQAQDVDLTSQPLVKTTQAYKPIRL